MIPHRLQFSGIRDYSATEIDLSGECDHVLISGANGSGKSTITFCWGAVLGSSKVDIEGLRSRNMETEKVWRAQISLVFLNEGTEQVDARKYVQFTLYIEQLPSGPVKKEYRIQEGDEIDQWEKNVTYTAGDQTFNFSEYRKQVLQKYAVDPDALYLIWYQQDVNQFAAMKPEERFRIFSEMMGITQMQIDWERSGEQVKEAQEQVEEARRKQTSHKFDLDSWYKELQKYEDRNRRCKEGLRDYMTGLRTMERILDQEEKQLEEQIRLLTEDKEDNAQRKIVLAERETELSTELSELKRNIERVTTLLEENVQARDEKVGHLQQVESGAEELKKEIAWITEQVRTIGYTDDQVRSTLEELAQRIQQNKQEQEEVTQQCEKQKKEVGIIQIELANLQAKIELQLSREEEARKVVAQYGHSGMLEQRVTVLGQRRLALIDEEEKCKREISTLQYDLKLLQQNHYVSTRQQQSLQYCKERNSKAYALRELVEMMPDAPLTSEHQFDAIKYTIFVEERAFQPPNDLYHVELPSLVPEYTITELPEYAIRIRETANSDIYAASVKALWWVKCMLEDQNGPFLQGNMLVDSRGRRGAQEQKEYILSDTALQVRLQKIETDLQKKQKRAGQVYNKYKHIEQEFMEAHTILTQVKQAEAVLVNISERILLQTQEADERKRYEDIVQRLDQAQKRSTEVAVQIALDGEKQERFLQYNRIYEEVRREKEKLDRLNALENKRKELQMQLAKLKAEEHTYEGEWEKHTNRENDVSREKRMVEKSIEDVRHDRIGIERRYNDRLEQYEAFQHELTACKKERERLGEEYDRLLQELQEEGWKTEECSLTLAQARELRENGKTIFRLAIQENVKETAPENYQKIKIEYERSQKDVTEATSIFHEMCEKMETFRKRLEDTIRHDVHKLNKRFIKYMERFGFEGDVSHTIEESPRGGARYYLYIKARKAGHRGELQEVSAKARGGKVGKGVSGGEESLSSLLFALALLKSIDVSPGYIVLDEFDSALDENRKDRVFTLYEEELQRKLIILTPKSHEEEYLAHFAKAYVVTHDARIPHSRVFKIKKRKRESVRSRGQNL